MRTSAMIPVAGTAVVYAIAQGWMDSIWQTLYNVSHSGGLNPGTGIQSPGSVISGIPTGGSDLALNPSGQAVTQLPGTFDPNSKTFTPNNSKIGPFQCDPSSTIGCIIPANTWATIQKALGL